jgi:hypothetical protein
MTLLVWAFEEDVDGLQSSKDVDIAGGNIWRSQSIVSGMKKASATAGHCQRR